MRKPYFPLFAIFLSLFACKKSDDTTTPAAEKYMSLTSGSTWNMKVVDNNLATTTNYTLTSTNRDSTINGKSYHVLTNSSTGINEYYLISGSDYYTFRNLTLATTTTQIEAIYLKDNLSAGGTWSQNYSITVPGFPLAVPVTLSYTIAEKGISRTVNGTAYSNVIHVTTAISSSLIPSANLTSDIHSYYAPKYGLIENTNKVNLNYMGITQNSDTKTTIVSATIL
ncbi:MAG TPA: hypothetical protein VKH37_14090 [Ferruginibacter sp.]|nr:hypothetical protein [Ferruginibacter sp.]